MESRTSEWGRGGGGKGGRRGKSAEVAKTCSAKEKEEEEQVICVYVGLAGPSFRHHTVYWMEEERDEEEGLFVAAALRPLLFLPPSSCVL